MFVLFCSSSSRSITRHFTGNPPAPLTGYHRVSRLLLLLGLVDTLHLITSLITFSLPTLAPSLGESASVIRWSLPIAQVSSGQITGKIIQLIQELDGDVCLHDNIHDCREISFYCSPTLHSEKQVRILKKHANNNILRITILFTDQN